MLPTKERLASFGVDLFPELLRLPEKPDAFVLSGRILCGSCSLRIDGKLVKAGVEESNKRDGLLFGCGDGNGSHAGRTVTVTVTHYNKLFREKLDRVRVAQPPAGVEPRPEEQSAFLELQRRSPPRGLLGAGHASAYLGRWRLGRSPAVTSFLGQRMMPHRLRFVNEPHLISPSKKGVFTPTDWKGRGPEEGGAWRAGGGGGRGRW